MNKTGWYKLEGSSMLHFLSVKDNRVLCKTKTISKISLSRFYKEPFLKGKCRRCENLWEAWNVTGEMPERADYSRSGMGTIIKIKNPKKPAPTISVGNWKQTKCPSCKTKVMYFDNGNELEAHACTVCGQHVQIMGAITC